MFCLFLEFVWSQEEHQNAGAWTFVKPRFENLLGIPNLSYSGRGPLCQPAVGVGSVHQQEISQLFRDTFKWIRKNNNFKKWYFLWKWECHDEF